MIQPRLGATLELERPRQGLRQLRALQPGGELAAAGRILGSQSAAADRRPVRPQRRLPGYRPGTLLVGQMVRRRPGPRATSTEFNLIGYDRQVSSRMVARSRFRLSARGGTSGGRHRQRRPGHPGAAGGHSAGALHRESGRHPGRDRRILLRHRPARQRFHQVLRGQLRGRVGGGGEGLGRAAPTSGATTTATSTRTTRPPTTTPTPSLARRSSPRRRPPAVEQPLWRFAR